MSNVEQEIVDLVGEVLDDKVEDALSNHYEFQDMMSSIDTLESQSDDNALSEEAILMRIAHLIVK